MRVLVTGSSGHLGEALVRTLRTEGHEVVGLDITSSPFTSHTASITDHTQVAGCMDGTDLVLHTATLHKPHVATHTKQAFIDTNLSGTLTLLEAAVVAKISAFIYTSTTSAFGHALRPPAGQPAAWVTEDVRPVPRNIYGVTKTAAEDVCELFHAQYGLPCIVLRTSRFFPEDDDQAATRLAYHGDNAKTNELTFRRIDIEDVVTAHQCAAARAASVGFGKYIISATTPFLREDLPALREDAASVLAKRVPGYAAIYEQLGWKMFPGIDRVYDNSAARRDLGWQPRNDFELAVERLQAGEDPRSELARTVGSKGYHSEVFDDGPYPVE